MLLAFSSPIKGEEKLPTETGNYIFWQFDRVLKSQDFKGTGSRFTKHNQYCNDYDMCTMAFLGIFTELDIPKKSRNKEKLLERAYFVPMFEITSSYILKHDTAGVKKQQIIFDIYELSARYARKALKQYQDSIPGYGTVSLMFKTIEMDAADFRNTLVNNYTTDVYIDKKAGAYETWRTKVNLLLIDSQPFATTPQECYRAILKSPIDSRYVITRNLMPDLNAKKRKRKLSLLPKK